MTTSVGRSVALILVRGNLIYLLIQGKSGDLKHLHTLIIGVYSLNRAVVQRIRRSGMKPDKPQPLVFRDVFDRQCFSCKHQTPRRRSCSAFPDEIPNAIWENEFDHRQAYPGDRGIRFEALEDDESPFAYEERIRSEKAAERKGSH